MVKNDWEIFICPSGDIYTCIGLKGTLKDE